MPVREIGNSRQPPFAARFAVHRLACWLGTIAALLVIVVILEVLGRAC